MKLRFYTKKICRLFSVALLVFIMTVSNCLTGIAETTPAQGYVLGLQGDGLSLFVKEDTGDFYIEDAATGHRWYSVPVNADNDPAATDSFKAQLKSALIVEYSESKKNTTNNFNSYEECVLNGNVKTEISGNSVTVTYSSATFGFSIPLTLKITDGAFVAEIDTAKIIESKSKYRVTDISFLPYFGAADGSEDGYLFVPDNTGGIIEFNNGKTQYAIYTEKVYGTDMVLDKKLPESRIKMPVYGIKAGDNAVFAIIENGAENATLYARTNGMKHSYAAVYAQFNLRSNVKFEVVSGQGMTTFEKGKIAVGKISVKYNFLNGSAADYSGMAAVYKDYLFSDKADIKVEPQVCLDLYGSVMKTKSFLGIRYNSPEKLTTASDVEKIVSELKKNGTDGITIRYNNWNTQEINSKIISSAKTNGSIGTKVEKLIASMDKKGVALYPSINTVMTYKKSSNPLHTLLYSARNISDTLVQKWQQHYGYGPKGDGDYILNYNTLSKNLNKLFKDISKKKITNIAFSDLGNSLYSEYSDKAYKRNDMSALLGKKLASYTEKNDLLLENPNAYAAVYADYIIGVNGNLPVSDLIDYTVPFVQLVYSGKVAYSTEALNLSGNPNKAFLKALESGSAPMYSLIYRDTALLTNTELNTLYSSSYKYWKDTVNKQYKVLEEVSKGSQKTAIVRHDRVANNVYRTEYANGFAVYVNYSKTDYTLENGSVVGSMNYYFEG